MSKRLEFLRAVLPDVDPSAWDVRRHDTYTAYYATSGDYDWSVVKSGRSFTITMESGSYDSSCRSPNACGLASRAQALRACAKLFRETIR